MAIIDAGEADMLQWGMGRLGYKHTPEALEKIRLAGLGRKHSEESKQKMREISHAGHYKKGNRPSKATEFKEGFTPWNKGKKTGIKPWLGKARSEETKEKIRKAKTGVPSPAKGRPSSIANEKHPNWKGDFVSYSGMHYWVSRKLGKPDACEHCPKKGLKGRQIHWANKSHQYKRELSDWLRLCAKCHKAYDRE